MRGTMSNVNIRIKKIHSDAVVPTQGSANAAGFDLYAYLDQTDHVVIQPHTTVMVGTGVAVAIPNDYWGGIFARSGLATKQGLRPANCTGVIDPDYRGELIVALHNDFNNARVVRHGDRIGQLVIVPLPDVSYDVVEDLDDTVRGDGGFGHSGV